MQTNAAVDGFTAYGASHQVVLVLLVVVAVALAWFGRTHREGKAADRLGRMLALTLLAIGVPVQLVYLTPDFWTLERGLPLQLCDLAWMVSAYGLWTHRRWAVALSYYWGLTLTTQAVITPDLGEDFPAPAFLLFWAMHTLVVWAAVYLTWGLGLSPDWRSYRTAITATVVWAVSVFAFNLVASTNYGYLNAKPASASILDLLGEWPWYVFWEVVIVAVVWALVTWPWVALAARRARVAGRRPSHTAGPA